MQGTGRYSIYVANYASGNVGPHALLEMDEAASDVPRGVVALSDVAAQAGVNKLTGEDLVRGDFGEHSLFFVGTCSIVFPPCAGGRGVVVGPILSQARSDVFCDNENGANFLFQNNGAGTFVDRASQAGEYETGSGGTLCCLKLSYQHLV